jgi:hypothetical protein
VTTNATWVVTSPMITASKTAGTMHTLRKRRGVVANLSPPRFVGCEFRHHSGCPEPYRVAAIRGHLLFGAPQSTEVRSGRTT